MTRRFPSAWPGAVLAVALMGCSEPSASPALPEARGQFVYRHYYDISREATRQTLAAWSGDAAPLSAGALCRVRVLVAYAALLEDRRAVALAETDLAEQEHCDTSSMAVGLVVRASLLQSIASDEDADIERRRARAAVRGLRDHDTGDALLLAMAQVQAAAREGDWADAQAHAATIGEAVDAPWLVDLARAGRATARQHRDEAAALLSSITKRTDVPDLLRTALGPASTAFAQGDRDIANQTFLARLLAASAWEAMRDRGPASTTRMLQFAERMATGPTVVAAGAMEDMDLELSEPVVTMP